MLDLPAPPIDPALATAKRQSIYLALLGPIVIWIVGMAGVWALASPVNPAGQCQGIGWGCTLTPRDTATFVAILGAMTLVPLVTAWNALLLLLPIRYRRPAVVANLALMGAVFVAGAIDFLV